MVSQRARLSKELGLTVGNVNLSDDLFNDEDLEQNPVVPHNEQSNARKQVCPLLSTSPISYNYIIIKFMFHKTSCFFSFKINNLSNSHTRCIGRALKMRIAISTIIRE